ncbi:MAG: glutamine--tRNA ligase/YqeY domain fusion protein, partial [Myxococcales bacterium]|nr:glutamine--tRNA ligase/YqeY domain fusion protein [Myxococcales bacterium]
MAHDAPKTSAPSPSVPKHDGDDGPGNFIEDIVKEDLAAGKHGGRIMTRFPPEPNGYLHIGHAKAICVNFGIAALTDAGACNLRFDDTNPEKEDTEYVDAIRRDIEWLGFSWGDREYYASDYFERLYGFAQKLIRDGKAYVDDQTEEEIRENRGNFYRPGVDSPYRNRSAEESLELLEGMRRGDFADGSRVLRAKIDMTSKDLKLRDPLMYRIRRVPHHRTGDAWCIYPMYDFAHGLSDAIEGVTHSLCSLEFQNHRPLYDWFVAAVGAFPDPPRQIEFARLNMTYTALSKRWFKALVDEKRVAGWDDPRMPTLSGLRRRGVTPEAIRNFCDRIGVARRDVNVDVGMFEHEIREHLNDTTPRTMAVLHPLKVILTNFPEDAEEVFECPLHPTDDSFGTREIRLTREIFIERDDFMENAPKKFFRLSPGAEVRLRYACIIQCHEAIKDGDGHVTELHCTWDPDSRGGTPADGRKIKGTLHWVSAKHATSAEVRLYDRLFDREDPLDIPEGETLLDALHPNSLEVLPAAKLEPYLARMAPGDRVQFERMGYFVKDPDSTDS